MGSHFSHSRVLMTHCCSPGPRPFPRTHGATWHRSALRLEEDDLSFALRSAGKRQEHG